MLLTRISFTRFRFVGSIILGLQNGSCHDLLHRLVFGKSYQPISPKTSSGKLPSLPRNVHEARKESWSVHHWGPARGYYGFAYYRQLCHNTGATKGSKVECQSLEANAPPKKLRWNLISFDLVKILRLTSSAPFSHFKSENHNFVLHIFETVWCMQQPSWNLVPQCPRYGPSWYAPRWFTFNSWMVFFWVSIWWFPFF